MSNPNDLSDIVDLDDAVPTLATPQRRGRKPLVGCLLVFGAVLGLGFVALMTLGLMLESGYLPPTEVTTGEDTPKKHVERVREIGALQAEEEVLLFYSWGVLDAAEGGSALTNRGVVIWFEDGDLESGYDIDRVPYAAIQKADIYERGSFLEDTLIEIETRRMYYFAPVSTEAGGDDLFLDRLLEEWGERGGHRPRQVPAWFKEAELE